MITEFTLGDVEVVRIVEYSGPFIPARALVPESDPEVWRDNAQWLAPDHWDPDSDLVTAAVQTWVLRGGGRTVVVDPGVGNGRERPGLPHFDHWQGDFPSLLAQARVAVEDVDIVVNTHVHADHVGWNTRDADGTWVPTFPNAEYLIPAADDHYFGPDNDYGKGQAEVDRFVYEDSIAPIHRAGQAVLWEGGHRVGEGLTLEPAPGHTPGSAVLRVVSGADRAVFVGDLLHSPGQILQPSRSSCFCLDPAQAAASRRRVLSRAAAEGELVVPAHFAGAGTMKVRPQGDGFTPLGR
ncbi:MBL fold metallo-hydrolase [Nonomuraea longicatena]|uniref:MBL fold metallo-hydrolase n=1 Tax=Nonomuraea longicatena TaxID=83682 RepID=A0ABP4AJ91_9ACTN